MTHEEALVYTPVISICETRQERKNNELFSRGAGGHACSLRGRGVENELGDVFKPPNGPTHAHYGNWTPE